MRDLRDRRQATDIQLVGRPNWLVSSSSLHCERIEWFRNIATSWASPSLGRNSDHCERKVATQKSWSGLSAEFRWCLQMSFANDAWLR